MIVDINEHIEDTWIKIIYYQEVKHDFLLWLTDLQGRVAIWGMIGFQVLEIYFENISDALLFKLTWL